MLSNLVPERPVNFAPGLSRLGDCFVQIIQIFATNFFHAVLNKHAFVISQLYVEELLPHYLVYFASAT